MYVKFTASKHTWSSPFIFCTNSVREGNIDAYSDSEGGRVSDIVTWLLFDRVAQEFTAC